MSVCFTLGWMPLPGRTELFYCVMSAVNFQSSLQIQVYDGNLQCVRKMWSISMCEMHNSHKNKDKSFSTSLTEEQKMFIVLSVSLFAGLLEMCIKVLHYTLRIY